MMGRATRPSGRYCIAMRSSHGRRSTGALPPKSNAEFVCATEDVLEVYHRPEDPNRPRVCLDEASLQLLGEVREPLPMRPGDPLCVDSEYQREGVEPYFMLMAPLPGWRQVQSLLLPTTQTQSGFGCFPAIATVDPAITSAQQVTHEHLEFCSVS
jgi:hypothetical protein